MLLSSTKVWILFFRIVVAILDAFHFDLSVIKEEDALKGSFLYIPNDRRMSKRSIKSIKQSYVITFNQSIFFVSMRLAVTMCII